MEVQAPDPLAAARVVALLVATQGRVDERAMRMLDRLDAFRSLAIERRRFLELAQAYAAHVGSHLGETSWLRDDDRALLDSLLSRVTDPRDREKVARLAAVVIEADGCISWQERMVHAHLMASWHLAARREDVACGAGGPGCDEGGQPLHRDSPAGV